jgi:AcrR family transcriptional regulator
VTPRPRKVADAAIFAAMQRVMRQVGPAELTLQAIAGEAGLTAGALVQRFGSKRGLMIALARHAAEGSRDLDAEVRRGRRSPLAALRACAAMWAALAPGPEAATRNLAYLLNDLTDPSLYEHLRSQSRATREWYERLIREAVAVGELAPGTNPRRLARTIEATLGGSLLAWMTYREGSAAAWLRRDLDAVLEPYRRR